MWLLTSSPSQVLGSLAKKNEKEQWKTKERSGSDLAKAPLPSPGCRSAMVTSKGFPPSWGFSCIALAGRTGFLAAWRMMFWCETWGEHMGRYFLFFCIHCKRSFFGRTRGVNLGILDLDQESSEDGFQMFKLESIRIDHKLNNTSTTQRVLLCWFHVPKNH